MPIWTWRSALLTRTHCVTFSFDLLGHFVCDQMKPLLESYVGLVPTYCAAVRQPTAVTPAVGNVHTNSRFRRLFVLELEACTGRTGRRTDGRKSKTRNAAYYRTAGPHYEITVQTIKCVQNDTCTSTAGSVCGACSLSYYDRQYESMFNSMWMIVVTFLSIGYGDIVPNTHCGRIIAITTGIMVNDRPRYVCSFSSLNASH